MLSRRGFWMLCAAIGVATAACAKKPPPGAGSDETSGQSQTASRAGDPTLPDELSPKAAPPVPDAGAKPEPWKGPWLAVTSPAAAIYSVTSFDKDKKLGYARNGGRLPVKPTPVSKEGCTGGWYEVVSGGYACGNLGTTDLEHPQVKYAIKAPDLEGTLPYQYARNAKNGTPLYKSVPSREQMLTYEPYLDTKKKSEEPSADGATAAAAEEAVRAASVASDAGILGSSPALDPDAGAPAVPWWQRDDAKDTLHEVKLEDLAADSDDVLAKRMVTGFYIAVDKTFNWNGRTWYKSTKGLVAPADRFWLTPGSKFQGIELDGARHKLPVAWVYGGRKTAPTYTIDGESKQPKPAKAVERFTALALTGKEVELDGIRYSELREGTYIKNIHVRITRPGPPPAEIGPNERWIDVNLKEQTLVAFEGTRAVYATLVSTGKQSTDKEKDHRTPSGKWRIREKHVTTTMDGNGTAAGDLPYSIEDVPFVMYFHQSYAVHGAFWHQNFGIQMSHGCVNLAPLDAKHLFLFADPPLPAGFHGAWSTKERPGSYIVVHD